MDISVFILCLSLAMQLTAAVFAVRLIMLPGRRIAGLITLTIILLMAFRRVISLYRFVTGEVPQIDFLAESIALSISFLLLLGILYVSSLIRSERRIASMLKDSIQHYQTLFEQSPDGVLLIDTDGRIIEFNDAAARDLGYTREEFSNLHLSDVDPVETPEEIKGRIEDTLREGKAEFEVNHRTKGGDLRDVHVITRVCDLAGEKVFHTIWRDVTRQKAMDKEVRYLASILEHVPDGVCSIDTEGKIVSWNEGAERILGYKADEIIGRPIQSIIPQERADGEMEHCIGELNARGIFAGYETLRIAKDGRRLPVEISGLALREGQKITGYASIMRDITERERAKEEIAERGAMLQQIMDTASVAIGLVDKSGRITHANRSMAEMFGRTLEDLVGCEYVELVHPSERETGRRSMLSLLSGEIPSVDLERLYWRKDGTKFWGHLACRRFRDVRGNELGLIGAITDISMQKQAEEALKISEARLNTILDNVGAAIFIKDTQYRYTYANRKVSEIFGRRAEEILGKSDKDFFSAESVEEIMRSDRPVIERGQTVTREETELVSSDNVPRTYWTVKLPLRDSTGTVTGLCGISTDITKRKQTEFLNDRLLKAISASTEGIAITDEKDRFVYVNDAHATIFGCSQDELIGKTWRDTVPTELVVIFEDELSKTLHNRAVGIWSGECPALRKDGTILPTEVTATARWDETGNYIGHICIVRNISERKRSEEALGDKEKFIRNILDTVDEGFIVVDRDFRILTANKAYCSQVGKSCDSVIGRNCYEISHKLLRPCYEGGEDCAVRHVFETGDPHIALHKHPDAKGSIMYVETKAFPIKDATGAVTSVIETVNNISERYLLEEERLKTQKLEAIGTLAGGIAHDFNNLLQGVFGYISMAKRMHDQKQKSLDMLEQAEQALHMSVNLTSQLLTFSKGGKPVTKRIALRSVIENSARFALSGSRAEYKIQVDEGLWMVEADEGQIGQVIQNLVLNAEQAMPMGGTITVAARNVSSRQEGLPPSLQEGKYVEIAIRDSGIGIPETYLPKIFDPYFTTKDKGSGLGLATSYSIIKNHGGFIDVKSTLGKGTTFFVYLPATGVAETLAIAVSEGAKALRKGRVLLMDDEEIVRNIAEVMIKSLGHEVELAENGEEAIDKYRESMKTGRQFDIVIMDLTIRGGMGGEEAMKELLQINPDIKAIVSSGYTDTSAISEYRTIGFDACLTKPYDIDSLNAALNSLLA